MAALPGDRPARSSAMTRCSPAKLTCLTAVATSQRWCWAWRRRERMAAQSTAVPPRTSTAPVPASGVSSAAPVAAKLGPPVEAASDPFLHGPLMRLQHVGKVVPRPRIWVEQLAGGSAPGEQLAPSVVGRYVEGQRGWPGHRSCGRWPDRDEKFPSVAAPDQYPGVGGAAGEAIRPVVPDPQDREVVEGEDVGAASERDIQDLGAAADSLTAGTA